jgi:hypothetical protein
LSNLHFGGFFTAALVDVRFEKPSWPVLALAGSQAIYQLISAQPAEECSLAYARSNGSLPRQGFAPKSIIPETQRVKTTGEEGKLCWS